MYTTEYNNVTGLLIGEDYIFTATQTGVDVYITITDTSNTVIEHGSSPLTVNNITANAVRLHATNNASCGSSSICTATTVQFILSCPQPVSLTAFNTSENSADLEWTEEGTATAWDIEWGTLGFIPTGTPTITGVTTNPYTLTGLTSGTLYQFYVRSDCGVDDGTSIWSGPFAFQTTADCSGSLLDITSTTNGGVCNEGIATLQATASGTGSEIYWYDAVVGGNLVGEGASFETPFLTETTSYWASEVLHNNNLLSGQAFANPTTFTNSVGAGGVLFNVVLPMKIVDVQVFGTNATGGEITIELRDIDNGNQTIASTTATITGGGTVASPIAHTIPLNFYVQPGNYRLVKTAPTTGIGLGYVSAANSSFPYPLGSSGSVTGGATATATSTIQYFFFNWTIEEINLLCESAREEVIATVHEIIGVDVTATESIIDSGDSTTLTVSSTNSDYTYEWTWDGGTPLTGASVTVSPTEHTTYTVTATDTVTGCQTSEEIEILVYNMALCDDIEVLTTTDASICGEGTTTTLQATASGNGSEIYWYDAAVGGNLVGQGPSFETPELTETASYWATEVYLDGGILGGQAKELPTSTSGYTLGAGLAFTATESFTIVDVTLYSNSTAGGTIPSIQLQTITGTLIAEVNNIPVPAAPGTGANSLAFQVPLNFAVPGPGDYRLLIVGTIPSLIRDTGAAQAGTFPYPLGTSGEIYGSILTLGAPTVTTYYYFYNWTISSGLVLCESDREEVIATVVPASTTPAPTGVANQLVYAGTTLADLNVTGTTLTWYSDAALTNQIPDTTLAYEGTYYVTQTIGYCEGAALAITVTLHCPTPNNLSTGTVTLNSAVLTWLGNGISSEIEWGLEGFTLGNGTEITNVTGTTHLLDGLAPDTHYDFYVRQDCGTDGISNWGGPYTFFTGYCVVTSTNTTYGIGNFATTGGILNINNSSGASSYSNFTSQSVAQFVGGAPVQFTITSIGTYTHGMGVWIDWNNNMVFDPGEHIYNSAAYTAVGTGSITRSEEHT